MLKKRYKSLRFHMIFELVIFIIVTVIIALAFAVVYLGSEVASVLDYEYAPYHSNEKLFESGAFSKINVKDALGKDAFFEVYNDESLLYSSRSTNSIPSIAIRYLDWVPSVEAITIKLEELPNNQQFVSYLNDDEVLINYYVFKDKQLVDSMVPTKK